MQTLLLNFKGLKHISQVLLPRNENTCYFSDLSLSKKYFPRYLSVGISLIREYCTALNGHLQQLKEWLSVNLQLPKPDLLGLILIPFIALYKKSKSFLCLLKLTRVGKTKFQDLLFRLCVWLLQVKWQECSLGCSRLVCSVCQALLESLWNSIFWQWYPGCLIALQSQQLKAPHRKMVEVFWFSLRHWNGQLFFHLWRQLNLSLLVFKHGSFVSKDWKWLASNSLKTNF